MVDHTQEQSCCSCTFCYNEALDLYTEEKATSALGRPSSKTSDCMWFAYAAAVAMSGRAEVTSNTLARAARTAKTLTVCVVLVQKQWKRQAEQK